MPSPFTKKFRSLLPGQRAELTVINADGTGREVIFTVDDAVIEAPNWHPSGDYLVFNAGGEIWRINIDGSGLKRIETGTIRDLNNDHVLSPDRTRRYHDRADRGSGREMAGTRALRADGERVPRQPRTCPRSRRSSIPRPAAVRARPRRCSATGARP